MAIAAAAIDMRVAGDSRWRVKTDASGDLTKLQFVPVVDGTEQPASLEIRSDGTTVITGSCTATGGLNLHPSHPLQVSDLPAGRHEVQRWPGNPDTTNFSIGTYVGAWMPVINGSQLNLQLNEPMQIRLYDGASPLRPNVSTKEFFHVDPLNNRTGAVLAGVWLNRGQFRSGGVFQRVA